MKKQTINAVMSYLMFFVVFVFALGINKATMALSVVPMTVDEAGYDAETTILGRVIKKESVWGDPSHRYMRTYYTIAIEDVVPPTADIKAGSTTVVSFWGGTIDKESQGIAGLQMPQLQQRYILMLRESWHTPGMTPVVGTNQGFFRVNANNFVEDVDGGLLQLSDDGRILRAFELKDVRHQMNQAIPSNLRKVEAGQFMNWLRTNLQRIKAAPSLPKQSNLDTNDPRIMQTFSKRPEIASHAKVNSGNIGVSPPRTTDVSLSPWFMTPDPQHSAEPKAFSAGINNPVQLQRYVKPQYVTLGPKPIAPIVLNPYPDSWAWPDDEQMVIWNYYAYVFLRYTTPKGTFGWPDGVFDLTGWPTSAQMQSIYGSPWDSNTLGVTWWRSSGGVIIEADVSLNPAFSWTLDDEWVFDGSSAIGFRQTMLHELGHVVGLDHSFSDLSIMNYAPMVYRAWSLVFADDAGGIRALFPDRSQAHTDLAVYLFRTVGYQNWQDATYPSSVQAGTSFTVIHHVENVGTTRIDVPTIEWYLSPSRNYGGSYYYLETATYSPGLDPFSASYSTTTSLTVPVNVPAGSYYLGAFIRDDEGAVKGGFPGSNNFAWSRTKIAVTPKTYTVTATAGANGSISPGSRTVTHGATTTFTVTPNAGYTAAATGCGGALNGTTYTTGPITAACTVTATFTQQAYTVTGTAGANGSISPASRTVAHGATTTFTVTPNAGYTATASGCGGALSGTTYTTGPITAACTVTATFTFTVGTAAQTVGLYNPATARFYLRNSNSGPATTTSFVYGPANQGWMPLVGDWNGDSIQTVGLYNPATARFYLRNSNSNGTANLSFGFGPANQGWIPLSGDWDGDGTQTIGLYNPATARFYLRNSNSSGTANLSFGFGPANQGWIPLVGDWNGLSDVTLF